MCRSPCLLFDSQALCSGAVFELHLVSFRNEHGLNRDGNCCNGIRKSGTCSASCKTFFRICLTHFQRNIPDNPTCSYATLNTTVLGDNNVDFPSDLPGNVHNPVRFPISFSWPVSRLPPCLAPGYLYSATLSYLSWVAASDVGCCAHGMRGKPSSP